MPVRKGSAEWKGNLKEGKGTVSTETGTLKDVAYDFVSRFEQGSHTNPEELVGAAHAACFSMAFANNLSNAGHKVNSIKTEDKVTIEKKEAGFTITKIEVNTVGNVEGIDETTFQKMAEEAKKGCPVSRALTGVEIVLNANLNK